MLLPPYFLPRPALDINAAMMASFEQRFDAIIGHRNDSPIEYTLLAPMWQFLCWLADTQDILLHGSGNGQIAQFEPRKSDDIDDFGNRSAVYAASDGIWPMYYAILDRVRYPMSLINGCFHVAGSAEVLSEPFYYFSISRTALCHRPWRRGFVYLLPRRTFEPQPTLRMGGIDAHIAQWASLVPVKPLARIAVGPEDFPFLEQIRGHDDAVVWERAAAQPDGFPWLDEGEH